jgi:breast cancer 2 susceptibility protein
LAPWHTKLGFRPKPSAATLNSIVPDGGVISMLFVTIVNAFPLAFIESREGGERDSRDEAEEQAARDQWEVIKYGTVTYAICSFNFFLQRQREAEGNKLREKLCKKLETMKGHVERLQNIAGSAMSRTSEGKVSLSRIDLN